PPPASTTPRRPVVCAASLTADAHLVSSAITSSLKAFRTSGRLSVRYSIGPSRRVSRNWYDIGSKLAAAQDIEIDGELHIRNTPNFGSGMGALNAADSPSASACRVCAGSRIPSSQIRAVE